MTRNIKNPPEYISRIKNPDSSHITDMATANPTFIAFYKQANKNGNIDVVYPKAHKSIRESIDSSSSSDAETQRDPNELLLKNCPDKWNSHFYNATGFFDDKCGLGIYTMGSDSTDGRTWVSE